MSGVVSGRLSEMEQFGCLLLSVVFSNDEFVFKSFIKLRKMDFF